MNALNSIKRIHQMLLLILLSIILAFAPLLACGSASASTQYVPVKGDSAGTVFTFNDSISNSLIDGDLYWLNGSPEMTESRVENDIIGGGNSVSITDSKVEGSVRYAAGSFTATNLKVGGIMTVAGYDITFGKDTSAKGVYSYAADSIEFDGTTKYAFLYAQRLVINGTIKGDAVVSAQSIVIGPDAKITGTLHIHSGQNVDVPDTASIANIDVSKESLNYFDQLGEIRSTIAPFFQIGGALFSLISFAILAGIMAWAFGYKMREANRVITKHPIPMVVLGIGLAIALPLAAALSAVLIFTLPLAVILVLVLLLAWLVGVPFTGSSLGMLLPGKMQPSTKAILGTVIATLLLQIPYLNIAISCLCVIYLLGYIGFTMSQGHDAIHNQQQAKYGRQAAKEADAQPVAVQTAEAQPTAGQTAELVAETQAANAQPADVQTIAADPNQSADK